MCLCCVFGSTERIGDYNLLVCGLLWAPLYAARLLVDSLFLVFAQFLTGQGRASWENYETSARVSEQIFDIGYHDNGWLYDTASLGPFPG